MIIILVILCAVMFSTGLDVDSYEESRHGNRDANIDENPAEEETDIV